MSQERRNPLPPGRYWITVITTPAHPQAMTNFLAWTISNSKRVTVKHQEPAGGNTRNGVFVIFEVNKLPIRFDQAQFGFPNVSEPAVHSSADTVSRPPVPTAADALGDVLGPVLRALDALEPRAKILLAIGAVLLLSRKSD